MLATAGVTGLGLCVIGSWKLGQMARREQAHEAQEACELMRPVAASTRDTSSEMATSARIAEQMFRDSAAALASYVADERERNPDADATWVSPTATAIADTQHFAEERRSAEVWTLLAARAVADLNAISERCEGHG